MKLISSLFLFLLAAVFPAMAGEIVVYDQVSSVHFVGATYDPQGDVTKHRGYMIRDVSTGEATVISTFNSWIGKRYRVQNYDQPRSGEFHKVTTDADIELMTSTQDVTAKAQVRLFVLRGRVSLTQIGPSQQIQVARTLAGIMRNVCYSTFWNNWIEEITPVFTFNATITNDSNANSRTRDQVVTLLVNNLNAAGFTAE